MEKDEIPDAHSGLPRPIERRLLAPYSDSFLGKVGAAAGVRALGVLIRKHPRAALHVLGAGALQAARTGYSETKKALLGSRSPAVDAEDADLPRQPTKVDRQKLRKLRKLLEDDAPLEPAPDAEERTAGRSASSRGDEGAPN